MRTLIEGGQIVNEGRCFEGSIVIEDEKIIEILKKGQHPEAPVDKTIDATGCFVLPGIIDTHVHFREPGMTEKADIDSESCAAAAGGAVNPRQGSQVGHVGVPCAHVLSHQLPVCAGNQHPAYVLCGNRRSEPRGSFG